MSGENNATEVTVNAGFGVVGKTDLMEEKNMAGVIERAAKIREAIETGGETFDEWTAQRAISDLTTVTERASKGAGATVAALAGGTGSGKSTLFNALTELEFADPGDLRPTTEWSSACMWSIDATELLDMIGVRPERRIQYHSILTSGRHDLDSLVLLDLPDHDSVHTGNSILVDKTLPLADVIIWVLDPQKYADHLIHSGYLAAMRNRREHMIVVLNQIDTVPEGAVDKLIADVHRLLDEDGLGGVPVYPVSARQRTGLEAVYAALRAAVSETEAVVATAHAELDGIRARLASSVGTGEVELSDAVKETTRAFREATGVLAVAESIRQAGSSWRSTAIAPADQPAAALTVAARDAWMSRARSGLPVAWREEVAKATPDAEKIRRNIGGAVRGVAIPQVQRGGAYTVLALGAAICAALIAGALLGMPFTGIGARVGLGVAAVAVLICAYVVARGMRGAAARRAAEMYADEAEAKLENAVGELLLLPAESILARHRLVRELLG